MISVIIPTLNEEEHLAPTLERIASFRPSHEVLVIDAGSSDRTVAIATELNARVIQSERRQRAAQMNAGAVQACGDVFLFLHADTILPQRAFERIEEKLKDTRVAGGAFRRYFLSESLFLQLSCRLAALRNTVFGWHLGDQAMFATAAAFRKLNGFRDMDRFEDLDFSRRMKGIGKVVTIPNPVLTSARRFEKNGPFKTTMRDFWWTMRYGFGSKKVTQRR